MKLERTFLVFGKPNCPHCDRAKNLLTSKGESFVHYDVSVDGEAYQEMVANVTFHDGKPPKTVPQIFMYTSTHDELIEKYIGGADQLVAFFGKEDLSDEDFNFDL